MQFFVCWNNNNGLVVLHSGGSFSTWSGHILMVSSFLTVQRNKCVLVFDSPVIDCRSVQARWWNAFMSKKVISYSSKFIQYLSNFSLCTSWGSKMLNSVYESGLGLHTEYVKSTAGKGEKRVHHPSEAALGWALFNLLFLTWPRSLEMRWSSGVAILILGHNKTSATQRRHYIW